MTEDRKPINPLERRETIGVEDGDRHRGEAVTPRRHGVGTDRGGAPATPPAPKAVPGETPER
ncbi:hypothetical protein [Methylobacterium platani]|uniref:Uncharacterized protein n=2 Tax=Methylobacterium platani TaxID=427683 RepID=A0A179SJW7_9HYPH|nr:hypothetical protein [Methylobacterium platani]KMO21135.1 hypothetical protein SQ03_04060 [Methylobacterium platani JCM 14648]OAS26863.1 hypothetical protein A5481_03920 [Methylobacterium platani]